MLAKEGADLAEAILASHFTLTISYLRCFRDLRLVISKVTVRPKSDLGFGQRRARIVAVCT